MTYYYLTTNSSFQNKTENLLSAYEMAVNRFSEKKWPIYRDTIGTHKYQEGDKFLVYLAGQEKYSQHFIGTADVDDKYNPSDLHYDENSLKAIMRGYIPIKNTKVFQKPVSVKKNYERIRFYKKKR